MAAGVQAGLYIHVPFCVRKCHYCDFNSYVAGDALVALYLEALIKELEYYNTFAPAAGLSYATIYVGGGTPTVLLPSDLALLVQRASAQAGAEQWLEVTVEANPGTVSTAGLAELRAAGANRLSLGAQSFDAGLLQVLGRIHTAHDIAASVRSAREAGFANINLDLMFALPGQTLPQWQDTVERALRLAPEHISCYSLIVEDGTPFGALQASGKLNLPAEDDEVAMYEWAMERLARAGYQHYEISSFARPGYRCRHNELYWRNEWYLGLGPGAHSHWAGERFANEPLPATYCRMLAQGQPPVVTRHQLSLAEQMDETLMMSMRLLEGITEERFRGRFGRRLDEEYPSEISRLVQLGLVSYDGRVLRLSRRGLLLGNQVFAAFLRHLDKD